jgi:hypothetical protein
MATLIHFIAENAFWFYLACILAIFFFLLFYTRARKNRKEALFGLELELADKHQQRYGIYILFSILLVFLVFVIQYVIAPDMPVSNSVAATATPDIFRTPPPTFTNITPSPTATITPTLEIPTVTPVFQATSDTGEEATDEETVTPTPMEQPPQSTDAICAINEPADGSTIEGEMIIIGSAYAEDFMFYKLEAYGPETNGVWASIIGDVATQPVIDGVLGTANMSGWAPGGYSLRVVIVDNTSNEVAGCFITINIAGQQ